jgi:hypothetical protein
VRWYSGVVCRVVADDCDDDQGTEAQKLDGIGKKIGLKIDEILATGKLKKLDTLNLDPTTKALNLIQQVHMCPPVFNFSAELTHHRTHTHTQISGFGPVAAKKLVEGGVTTLEDLEKIKHTFTHHQRIGARRSRPTRNGRARAVLLMPTRTRHHAHAHAPPHTHTHTHTRTQDLSTCTSSTSASREQRWSSSRFVLSWVGSQRERAAECWTDVWEWCDPLTDDRD